MGENILISSIERCLLTGLVQSGALSRSHETRQNFVFHESNYFPTILSITPFNGVYFNHDSRKNVHDERTTKIPGQKVANWPCSK